MDSLTQDYDNHPAFSFKEQPYSIDLSKVQEVDLNYKRLVSASSKVRALIYEKTKKTLETLVTDIFNNLKLQVRDQYEWQFLDELYSQSIRLLNEELQLYRTTETEKYTSTTEVPIFNELIKNHFIFHKLSKTAIGKIKNISSGQIKELKKRAAKGLLKREDLSFNSGRFISKIVKVLNREYRRHGILQAVSAYMGKSYEVGGLALELSVPQSTWWKNILSNSDSPRTMYAHIDESKRYPKAIVYLSDVTIANGPSSCYPRVYEAMKLNVLQEVIGRVIGIVGSQSDSILNGYYGKAYHQSMSSEKFRQHFMRLPTVLRFNSHLGWDILPGSDIEKELLSVEQIMLGEAGTNIVFDGARLFHRGGLIESGERIVLQVVFSEKPILFRSLVSLMKRVFLKFRSVIK